MVAKSEPLVKMAQITRASVLMNLALAVVPELDDLTVGGQINGSGLEGSSHLYGLFSDTIVAYEMILGNGQVVRATKDNEYSDLFYAIPWSQGTLPLGDITDLAKGYIDYFTHDFGDESNKKVPDFVETIIYNPNEAVCMTGEYVSKEEAKRNHTKVNSIGWWFKPWSYQHAQTALKKGEFVEYIPAREYYHRHTPSYFWEMKLILPFSDQWWFRFLLGWMMPPKIPILKATQFESIQNYYHDMHVLQDLLVPLHKVSDALEWAHREMEVYPIWVCPQRLRQGSSNSAGRVTLHMPRFSRMEQWLIKNHGFETQYAVSELSEKDFWKMFDGKLYEKCRRKYKAVGNFMTVYYKSEKGKKTEEEVQEAANVWVETPYAQVD
uniref:Delta(24)-sterol reductase n=1 Tax=Tanacetum cinerariifolium TaxID=118510 RepID=A0A6L2K2I2_TANCI|nr:delta(24)-sterol reductase [Tanacetum cinerariifolium]